MASELDIECTPTPQPQQIRLDTTTACNAKCDSCHRFTTDRKGTMPVELYTEIINDISRWEEPLFELIPVNYGEFFLYEHWFDLLNLIKEKLPRTRVAIPTNGSLIDEETIKKLITIPNIWVINFSINGFFKETYESFMGLPAENMDRIHRTVMRLKTLRPDITIRQSMVFDPRYSTDLERDVFEDYFSGTEHGFAIRLEDVRELPTALELDEARRLCPRFRPPQSFQRLPPESPLSRALDLPVSV